nr:protein YgfX [Azomonas macrocytogenes]
MLLVFYLVAQFLALLAITVSAAPGYLKAGVLLFCVLHAVWVLPGNILLTTKQAVRGLRHDDCGWWLWSEAHGWQAIQLRPDSMAWPALIILRYRLPGQWRSRGVCIPRDALPRHMHRRLRVRLKFSRRRWVAPE